jgi:hypothetical protein
VPAPTHVSVFSAHITPACIYKWLFSACLWCLIVFFLIRQGFEEVSYDRSHNVLDLDHNIVPPVSVRI